ncbi:NUDIX hydrolase [Streptomyces sp. NPDC012637]|uniref:NUDIX hydrolase n=1 Tax=Streptomyces sp. NPDC012637 TaxID=3364842 RepID=UPI0036E875F5
MSRPAEHPVAPPVVFVDTERLALDFVECPPPPLSDGERREVDRRWAETRGRNPATFDGPLVAALGLDLAGPGRATVRWARTTYRHRALREIRPPGDVPGSVYVTVLLPTDEGLVLGRGSRTTAAPGRWSLPGGAAEPPPAGCPLGLAALRGHAVRELAEEVGVTSPEAELRLWALTRGTPFGSLGFHFLAPSAPADLVRHRHAALAAAESARGVGPELDAIGFAAPGGPAPAPFPCADYLPQVLERYAAAG